MLASILAELEMRLARGLREDALRTGFREATARVLLALEPGEAIRMSELAARMVRDATTATRFVDRAVREDLVARRPGAEDRRQRVVGLTLQGEEARRVLLEVQGRRAAHLEEAILAETGLGSGQVEWFLGAFARGLAAELERAPGGVSD
jgi:DNA-binding MarR family transcriptional regulator